MWVFYIELATGKHVHLQKWPTELILSLKIF
jgi:hypothetical protein